ncbi:MAG: DUF2203 domain-containing protein [Pirellulales bacterium]|nr:DUF2203 domain-containing protein [Pirellulales bacterium]
MSEQTESDIQHKLFTLEQANAMLPLVRAIVQDLSVLSQDVIDRRERLAGLKAKRAKPRDDLYQQEVQQIEQELQQDTLRLREFVEELQDLGVEPKNGPEGIVDFRCLLDGRVVYLCWKLGENRITHWHELEAGFAGRQTLPVEFLSGNTALSSES